jgi:hypothetical protein
MKTLKLALPFFFLLAFSHSSFAIVASPHPVQAPTLSKKNHDNIKSIKIKISEWKKRLIESSFHKIRTPVKKSEKNQRGLFSLILWGVGLLLLATPLGILSIFINLAGLVLGIMGLKYDRNNTLSIIGIVMNGLTFLLILLTIIALLIWLSIWFWL